MVSLFSFTRHFRANGLTLSILVLILTACNQSGSSPKKPQTGTVDPAVSDPYGSVPCTRDNCPKVSFTVSATGSAGAVLQVTLGSRADWTFTATSTEAPSRIFIVYDIVAATKPASMFIEGQKSSSLRVTWTPAATDPTSGTLTASVRDITMCEATATTATNCSTDFTATGAYDDVQSLSWQITNMTSPNVIGTGGGGGFLQILMQIGLPLIQSMMSGGDMDFSSILGSMGGLFTGGLGGTGGGLGGLTGLTGTTGLNSLAGGNSIVVPNNTNTQGIGVGLPVSTDPNAQGFPTYP